MNYSSFFSLNLKDATNGFVVAFLTAFLTAVSSALSSGTLPLFSDLKTFALIGITAGVSYITKNLLTNNSGELLKKDA